MKKPTTFVALETWIQYLHLTILLKHIDI